MRSVSLALFIATRVNTIKKTILVVFLGGQVAAPNVGNLTVGRVLTRNLA